ncbi:MAG: hypothetical protein ACRD20_20625 [Terriglobales bacterium]
MSAPSATIADFPTANPPRCMHCGEVFPNGSPVERFGEYVVVECKHCGLSTPFKLEEKRA